MSAQDISLSNPSMWSSRTPPSLPRPPEIAHHATSIASPHPCLACRPRLRPHSRPHLRPREADRRTRTSPITAVFARDHASDLTGNHSRASNSPISFRGRAIITYLNSYTGSSGAFWFRLYAELGFNSMRVQQSLGTRRRLSK